MSIVATRADQLDDLNDVAQEALTVAASANWLDKAEASDATTTIIALVVDGATDTGPFDAVDGPIIERAIQGVRGILESIFDRKPERMKRKAVRLKARGRVEKAAALLTEAAEREARMGNSR